MATPPHRPECSQPMQISTDLRKLFLNQMDAGSKPCREADRRNAERYRYRNDAGIVIAFESESGPDQEVLVHPRNISQTGIAFMHEAYVYPETRCRILLQGENDDTIEVTGTVVDCRHVHDRLHEIGITFDYPIDIGPIVDSPDNA